MAPSYIVGPHLLMEEDVVLVTLHYRLGVLGFTSLENDNIQVERMRETIIRLTDILKRTTTSR